MIGCYIISLCRASNKHIRRNQTVCHWSINFAKKLVTLKYMKSDGSLWIKSTKSYFVHGLGNFRKLIHTGYFGEYFQVPITHLLHVCCLFMKQKKYVLIIQVCYRLSWLNCVLKSSFWQCCVKTLLLVVCVFYKSPHYGFHSVYSILQLSIFNLLWNLIKLIWSSKLKPTVFNIPYNM